MLPALDLPLGRWPERDRLDREAVPAAIFGSIHDATVEMIAASVYKLVSRGSRRSFASVEAMKLLEPSTSAA